MRHQLRKLKRVLYGCANTSPVQEAVVVTTGLFLLVSTSGLLTQFKY